jgi:hypothetical protein
LSGHYHRLPAATPLPQGLGVIADGADVDPTSLHQTAHHTLYPTVRIHVDDFIRLFMGLPWQYAGKK